MTETQEAKKLISENNIKFVEAIAYYSHPLYIELRNLIDKKEIGDIVSIDSSFGFKVKKIDPSSRLFNKKLGGGVILDLGCYPISFLMLFEKDTEKFIIEKKKISYSSTNVDDFAEATINIKDEVKANIKISLKENLQNNCIIKGTKGQIFIPSPCLPVKNSYLEVQSDKGNYKKFFDIGDYITINISSPNTENLRDFHEDQKLISLIQSINLEKNNLKSQIPIMLKISPDINENSIDTISEIVSENSISALILTNTSHVNRENLSDPQKSEPGGLSGKPMEEISNNLINK